jgi:hypothetical protein
MKRIFQVLVITLLIPTLVQAADLKRFLQACAWGTVLGAGAGVVSLALTDKPSESWNNVAKGASLGLYAGIAYGVLQINAPAPQYDQHPDFTLAPKFHEGKVEGVQVTGMLYSF